MDITNKYPYSIFFVLLDNVVTCYVFLAPAEKRVPRIQNYFASKRMIVNEIRYLWIFSFAMIEFALPNLIKVGFIAYA